jgi:four helix bundle suffix protein
MKDNNLIPLHGGYRQLKTFQLAELIYDLTSRFCDRYISARSRTHDQMVQAARSGMQNIAEGSQASGTSKKMELKLTNVARASLEELRQDYEAFLRQKGWPQLKPNHPVLVRFKNKQCSTMNEFREWVGEEHRRSKAQQTTKQDKDRTQTDTDGARTNTEKQKHPDALAEKTLKGVSLINPTKQIPESNAKSVPVGDRPCESVPVPALVANGVLSLLNLCCYLLDRQLAAQAKAFEEEGGFTERLYRKRTERRNQNG